VAAFLNKMPYFLVFLKAAKTADPIRADSGDYHAEESSYRDKVKGHGFQSEAACLKTAAVAQAEYRIYECVGISVNGRDLGVRAFSPYIWQGPGNLLKQGGNNVKLAIANTLANMFEGCYY